jgi:hypothetical protein|tara:strand:- start:20 stop:331 length:312 start_codon:yes stop_codon:yes gene_type:complete
MEKSKIDRFVDAFRTAMYHEFHVNEEGMVANPPGGSGGFSASSDAKGPTAGYDREMKFDGRNKFVRRAIKDLMDRKDKRQKRKESKTARNFNPYFDPKNGRSS